MFWGPHKVSLSYQADTLPDECLKATKFYDGQDAELNKFNLKLNIKINISQFCSRFSLEIETYYTPDGGHQVLITIFVF